MQTNPIQELVTFLKQQNKSDDEINSIAAEITQAAFHILFTNAMAAFYEEDITAIEQCQSTDDANSKIMELYTLRTGKNVSEELLLFLKNLTEEYKKNLQTKDVEEKTK